jgi:predicted small secreted protein
MSKRLFIAVLVITTLVLTACNAVRGSGNVETEARTVSDFSGIDLSGSGEVIVTQAEAESLTIEAEDNLIPLIETEVRNGILVIGFKENTAVLPTKPIRFLVSMPTIDNLAVSGSGEIVAESVTSDNLELDVNGSGDIGIDQLTAESLTADISGSGDLTLAGAVAEQRIDISGSGKYAADALESDTADVAIGGSGKATIWANKILDAEIGGSGEVNYYGSPTVNSDISGSGDVNSLGGR